MGTAGLTLVPVLPKTVALAGDGDLEGGASSAFRVVEASAGLESRFLNVLGVADGGAPALAAAHVATTGSMEGVVTGSTVVLFSSAPHGAESALPFSYTVPGTMKRTHLLANLSQAIDVTSSVGGGNTVIEIKPGGAYTPGSSGLVAFSR